MSGSPRASPVPNPTRPGALLSPGVPLRRWAQERLATDRGRRRRYALRSPVPPRPDQLRRRWAARRVEGVRRRASGRRRGRARGGRGVLPEGGCEQRWGEASVLGDRWGATTATWGCSWPAPPAGGKPSSTASCICPRNEPEIREIHGLVCRPVLNRRPPALGGCTLSVDVASSSSGHSEALPLQAQRRAASMAYNCTSLQPLPRFTGDRSTKQCPRAPSRIGIGKR